MLNMKGNIMSLAYLLVDFCFAELISKPLTRGYHCLFPRREHDTECVRETLGSDVSREQAEPQEPPEGSIKLRLNHKEVR